MCITFRNIPKVPFPLNTHDATESTAATYTERTIRKKSCLNSLWYNSWKHFKIHSEILFSVSSFISSNFPPMKISKFYFPPSFSTLLDFEKFQFPQILLSLKIQSPPPPSQRDGGGSCYGIEFNCRKDTEPLQDSLLFTTKSPGTHLINLERSRPWSQSGWVDPHW